MTCSVVSPQDRGCAVNRPMRAVPRISVLYGAKVGQRLPFGCMDPGCFGSLSGSAACVRPVAPVRLPYRPTSQSRMDCRKSTHRMWRRRPFRSRCGAGDCVCCDLPGRRTQPGSIVTGYGRVSITSETWHRGGQPSETRGPRRTGLLPLVPAKLRGQPPRE